MPRLAASLGIAGSLLALSAARAGDVFEAFGTGSQQTVISAAAFVPATEAYAYNRVSGVRVVPTGGFPQIWAAPLGLPSGALLEEIRVLVNDQDAALDLSARLIFWMHDATGSKNDCYGTFFFTAWSGDSAGLDGRGFVTLTADDPLLIENLSTLVCPDGAYHALAIEVDLSSPSQELLGAVVVWRRSVSDAPSAATFNDVPLAHPFVQFIEALAASGITAGCGAGNYCPDSPITRGQMAVFLAKALGLHWPL